tara:strand:+ start:1925 stop:2152 length:228 start_codon:yes stop_codon:yes gene_type:complete
MTNSSPQENPPKLNLDGKEYNISSLSDESKKLLEGLNIANAQIRLQEDSLKLMILGRSSLIKNLKHNLKDIKPIN